MRTVVWVFDVDGCLVDSLTGTSLRPGTIPLVEHLHESGCTVLLWSAGGGPYARRRADELGVAELFDGFHGKDTRDEGGRYEVDHLGHGSSRLVFVDDRPEDLPTHHEVIAVSPYLAANPHDRALHRVARRAGLALER
ncbi:MAG: HAD family hydrolase [Acidimicrobiia bacterium]